MLQVRVTVLDKNDVAPTWGPGPWNFDVSEDAPPSTIVTILKAYDPDTIGTLKYTLIADPKSHMEPPSPFTLDSNAGYLRLSEALDRETKSLYTLTVQADDGLQHSNVTLTIQVSAG